MMEIRWLITGETRVLQWRHKEVNDLQMQLQAASDWQDVPTVGVE